MAEYGYPGAHKIGFLLGGGAKQMKAEAFDQGRLRTAQTELALENARVKQLERAEKEAIERELQGMENELIEAGVPNAALHARIMRAGRGNANQLSSALLGGQEFNFREGVADVDTDPEQRHRYLQGIQGTPSADVEAIGTGMFADLTEADQTPRTTLLGDSMIDENRASESASTARGALYDAQRLNPEKFRSSASTTAAGPTGVRTPANFMVNPGFDPMQPPSSENPPVIPIPGGPSDPNVKKPLGVRERQVVARIVNAGLNTAADLGNIMRMPSGVDSGVLGTGIAAFPGISVLDATAGHLKYKLSDSEVRDFTRILGGLTNQMATLEGMGMAATESMREAYAALALRPGDTIEDKMMALALIRQTTENGLQTISSVNPLPKDTQAEVDNMLNTLRQNVPFTPRDVMELKYGEDPALTLGGKAKEAMGDKVSSGALNTSGAEPDQPDTVGEPSQSIEEIVVANGDGRYNAQGQVVRTDGWILMKDGSGVYAWVSPDGTQFEEIAQ